MRNHFRRVIRFEMIYLALFLILFAGSAVADRGNIVFECQAGTSWSSESKIAVVAEIDNRKRVPVAPIRIADTKHFGRYSAEGLKHRWDFGTRYRRYETEYEGGYALEFKPDGTLYAFVIEADGTGWYFDFSDGDTETASQQFVCREINPQSDPD